MIDDKPYAPKKVGKRLRWLRNHLDMNQEEFAESLGMDTTSSVSQWETGAQNLSKKHAFAIFEVYGISMDWVYFNRRDGLPLGFAKALASSGTDPDLDSE